MPELPEVQSIKMKLAPLLVGGSIQDIEVLRKKNFIGNPEDILRISIQSVLRKGKVLVFRFSNKKYLLTHLKMTGQIIVETKDIRFGGGHPSADWVSDLPTKHTRVILSCNDGIKLYFNDMRTFGWMKIVDDEQLKDEFKNYGPDVNRDNFNEEYLAEKIEKKQMSIKQVLLDTSIVAGIGNIYACDALHRARIHPGTPAKKLSKSQIRRIVQASKYVIDLGIELGGATIDTYTDINGFAGKYQNKVRVYGLEGQPCKECGTIIEKIILGGRGTFFCPKCQKQK